MLTAQASTDHATCEAAEAAAGGELGAGDGGWSGGECGRPLWGEADDCTIDRVEISELTVPGHRRTESPEERKARIEADDWSLDFAIACADGELFPDPDAEDARIGLRPSLSEDDKQVKL